MKKIIFILFLVFLALDISGCGSLKGVRGKFIREKKDKEERPIVILALRDDEDIADYHELYRKHYFLWQYWHDELIDSIEENFKKQQQCVLQVSEHLEYLKKYVILGKQDLLNGYIGRVNKIKNRMTDRRLSDIRRSRIAKELKKLKRLIDKEYRYSEIKDYIITPSDKE
ncbi:MAG: hypothetical protein P9L98_05685 [Candidatus Kaelpia imicola]|nr:hypothetical protein [Candidatus Kaelpia imicola]